MIFNEAQTLIVVYKEELYCNYIKKLVETKDDNGENDIVGTRDGSIHIVAWTEKVWWNQKKAGNINDKVLFIGNIKGVDKLLPIIDVKYDEYGIQYGWAGNQAVLYVNNKTQKLDDYQKFFDSFCQIPVPANLKINAVKAVKEKNGNELATVDKQKRKRVLKAIKGYVIGGTLGTVFAVSADIDRKIQQQKFIHGIYKLYENHLETFMNN